jgi:zinc protease
MVTVNPVRDYPNSSNIVRVQLANGITILVYENFNTQSVVISGSLYTGSLYESPEKSGLAALATGALMRGTLNRDFDAIHSALEEAGADVGVSTGTHKTGFSGKSLAEDLPLILEMLQDVLRHPSFPEQHVERLRGEVLTWLQYRQQDTRYQAGRAFRETLYPQNHPYFWSARGTLETIPNLTIEDMREFHNRHFGPRGMIIAIVGAVSAETAISLVRRYFEDWENSDQPSEPELPTLEPLHDTRRHFVGLPGKTQSDIVMGVVGPSRFSPDYHAATMANSILGQFGMMGRIGDIVREKSGMAYYASSRIEGGYGPGAWSISAGVNPTNVERAISLSIDEVRRLATELVEDFDLEDNQANFTGRLPLQLASNEGIAGTLHGIEAYGLGLDYLLSYRDMIYRLTKEDLMEAVRRYWNPHAYVVAIAGPETK